MATNKEQTKKVNGMIPVVKWQSKREDKEIISESFWAGFDLNNMKNNYDSMNKQTKANRKTETLNSKSTGQYLGQPYLPGTDTGRGECEELDGKEKTLRYPKSRTEEEAKGKAEREVLSVKEKLHLFQCNLDCPQRQQRCFVLLLSLVHMGKH